MKRKPVKMVDISVKNDVLRQAVASGKIVLKKDTINKIRTGQIKKGDPLTVAQIAAINAVKQTPMLIPLCHQIPISSVTVNFTVSTTSIATRVEVVSTGKTGVEMEALIGVSIALNNIWDMVKYLEKDDTGQYPNTKITEIKVLHKIKKLINYGSTTNRNTE